jgi:membrane-anchored protein YejM (alkaline phosphatase superfamily)
MDRPQRLPLVRWGGWYFLTIGLLLDVIGLRYMFDYPWPAQGIARFYSVIAFASHFALLALAWALVVLPLTLLAPRRRLVAGVSVFAAAVLLAAVLIDSLSSRRTAST